MKDGDLMTLYEHVFIARAEISPQSAQALAEEFGAIVSQNGGSVDKTEYWGLRELAYPIKKSKKGHYFLMNINTDNAQLNEMERQMKLHDGVLRYFSLRVDSLDPNPSVQMQNKDYDERESWNKNRDDDNLETKAPISDKKIETSNE